MSKKGLVESFQVKITRNDRFAQMSHQEKVIEQKKKEIQARLEQKQKASTTSSDNGKSNVSSTSKQNKSPSKSQDVKKSPSNYNMFSNDGSFLDQFKQMKEKKIDQKLKSFKSKDNQERNYSDDRSVSKNSRWSQRRRSPSPKERISKPRVSRFSDKPTNYEPKININTSYSNLLSQTNFDPQVSINPQNVTGQPLLKNIIPPPGVAYPTPNHTSAPVIAAPPILLNVPPPQVLQTQIVVPPPPNIPPNTNNMLVTTANVISLPPPNVLNTISTQPVTVSSHNTISVPPPCIPTIELSSIPPPNPIQVHNIPQPEPINTLTIPPPAPIQVQNIPPPSPIHLNEIPNPKPLDLMNIPTPNESVDKSISDPDFIKNIPPPNKSVPPPSLPEVSINMTVPPPPNVVTVQSQVPTCLPPPNILPPTSMPPPQPAQQNVQQPPPPPPQSIMVHSVPPPQLLPPPPQSQSTLQNIPPPPPPQNTVQTTSIQINIALQNQIPVSVVPPPPVSVSNAIPSLMAQPVLPPPGMGLAPPPPININCPPPIIPGTNVMTTSLQGPPPSFVNQPPPMTSQMPPMNVPPPPTSLPIVTNANIGTTFKDINAGSSDYESMASLGRMVAQCGSGIEDIVRQRKPQDPSLWFLFHKESAAHQQYLQLIEEFKGKLPKIEVKEENYKPEDIYEPEMAIEDDDVLIKQEFKQEKQEEAFGSEGSGGKRKRKSRWGEKDTSVPPPALMVGASSSINISPSTMQSNGQVMISKVTRNNPALIQYAVNTFGSSNLTEEEWKKAEDHFKINLLYQDMLRKRQEVEKLQLAGRNKYDYDSDEDIDGGTWEHKLREKEMVATQLWAAELTKQAEGKHHIGDFLPPEELKKFMEKSTAVKEGRQPELSDYKEFKLKEDNIGFKMLQKLGWSEGQGLGSNGAGIVEPVNKAAIRDQNQGLGLNQSDSIENNDDEYDAYRKRMMLAYRFRPNPLNNPRRPYY